MSELRKSVFLDHLRESLFAGKMKQSQVLGISSLLDEWAAHHADGDPRWFAYMLATAHHETAQRMQPIKEFGMGRRRAYGRPDPATGERYYGRGFVQLTWNYNYKRLGASLGISDELYLHPDKALDPAIASRIMFVGMIEGLFTGKKLGDYFSPTREDWTNARRIINGTDKASLIADYGRKYFAALRAAN
jgi:putative chitinase